MAQASYFLSSAVRRLVSVVLESVQLEGARRLDLERATSGDTPEEELPELRLNLCLVSEVFVQILATGVGTLAFIWATVVLLGGFSAFLHEADFWVITGIVFVQAAKIVGVNSNTEAIFFAQVPPAFLELGVEHFTRWGRRRPLTGDASGKDTLYYIMQSLLNAWDLIRFMALLTFVLLLLPLVAGCSFIALSIFRLVIITRHKYGGDSADGSSNPNVLRALIFFYALVLAQGGFFLVWLCILLYRLSVKDQVCSLYQFEDKDKRKLIDKYINRTSSACIKTGVLSTINRKLVSFAVDLLKSEYSQDRISGVLVLHTMTSEGAHKAHKQRALAQIHSSPECIARMFALLSSKSEIDEDSKVRLAQVVALLASNLRLSNIDKAMDSISSLIDPYLAKIPTTARSINNGENIEPLIIHGLIFLAKLAKSPDNCSMIYGTEGLFSRITAPISNRMYEFFRDDDTAIEITKQSLELVSKLVKGTDNIIRDILEKKHSSTNGFEVTSIRPILESDHERYNKLKAPAIKIVTKLALANTASDVIVDETMIIFFINFLIKVFFNDQNGRYLRKTAGKALALLAIASRSYGTAIMNVSTGTAHSVVEQLSDMFADRNNKPYQIAIAQLLSQFCIDCCNTERESIALAPAKTILNEVFKVICNVDQEVDANQPDSPRHNRSRGQVILQFCLPCIDISSFTSLGDNGHNQRPATSMPLHLFPCLGTSSPGTRLNQRERNGNTLQNQALGSQNQSHQGDNQGGVQGIISGSLRVLNRVVSIPRTYNTNRHNRNIHSDNVQNHQLADAPIEPGRRKALVAFLGLAVQMCEKLIEASDFDAAVLHIPLSEPEFVEKLKEIIEMCIKDSVGPSKGKRPSVDYLVMIKSVTKLCAWVMQTKPVYVTYFQEKNIGDKLKDAEEAMRGLELAVLLTCSTDETANYKTLSSIVEYTTRLIYPISAS